MKKIVVKLISIFQILILASSIIVPTIILLPTTSIASIKDNVENMEEGKVKILDTSLWLRNGLFVWIEQKNYDAACFSNLNSDKSIKLDAGTDFYVSPKDDRNKDYYSELWLMENGSHSKLIRDGISNISKITIPSEECSNNGEDTHFQLVSYYYEDNEKIDFINIYVRQNRFKFTSNNANTSSDGQLCDNAIIKNNTLYIKPNTTVDLTTEWTKERISSSRTGIFYQGTIAAPNKPIENITYTAPSTLGKDTTLYWENSYNSSCSLDIVVSNFASEYFNITPLVNSSSKLAQDIFINPIDNTPYSTTRNIYVANNTNATIKIAPQQKFAEMGVMLTSLKIWDVSNFSKSTLTTKTHDTCYTIEFTAQADNSSETEDIGLLKIEYVDYLGNKNNLFWQIIIVDSTESIKKEEGATSKEETGTTTPTLPSTTTKPNTNTTEKTPVQEYTAPKLTYKGEEIISSSCRKYSFTIEGCTNAKYSITKTPINSDGSPSDYGSLPTNYNSFKGTKITNPNSFTITLNSPVLGSGYYDLTVIAKNTDDNVTSSFAISPIFINNTPIVGITKITNLSTSDSKKYTIYSADPDQDKTNTYYYLVHKDTDSTYTKPSVTDIKNNGIKLDNSSSSITLDTTNYKSGYYDLTAYVEDSNGASSTSYISNILITKAPDAVFTIAGEDGDSSQGYTYSTAPKNLQTVSFKIKDDDAKALKIDYFVADKNLSQNAEIFKSLDNFRNSGYEIKSTTMNSKSGSININIPATAGKRVNKYIYMRIEDSYGATTYLSTGSIVLDNTPLKLDCAYTNKLVSDNKIGYSIGDSLEVTLRFSHYIADNVPDLYMNFGDSERKQDSVKCDKNKVTYIYNITDSDTSGDLTISRMDYSINNFTDVNNTNNTYSTQITDEPLFINIVDNQYYIDTTQPEITYLELALTTSDKSTIYDDTINNKKYVSNIESGKFIVKYSENVKNYGPTINFLQGNKAYFMCSSNNNTERNEETYNLSNYIYMHSFVGNDGAIKFNGLYNTITLKDLAGNNLNESDLPNIKYTLNGTDVGDTEIILDNNVYTGKIMINDNNINSNGAYAIGTEIQCFAEYKNENSEDYRDLSGIKTITLKIYGNASSVDIKDKNGSNLEADLNTVNDDTNYLNMYQYTLTESQLPISFVLTQTGDYKIATLKTDNAGNEKAKTVEIVATSAITVSEELSGLHSNLDSNTNYNLKTLKDIEKKYTLALKLDSTLSNDIIGIRVTDTKSNEMAVNYSGQKTNNNETYEIYKFDFTHGGTYFVEIYNTETNTILLSYYISIDNIYIPGDTDYDGIFTAQDIVNMSRYIAGLNTSKFYPVFYPGDVNNDNTLSITDIIFLSRYISQDSGVTLDDNGYIILKNN